MSVYIHLFHGRTSPDEELEDWGSDGPVFGPLSWVHTTYGDHVKLGDLESGDTLGDLHVVEDMIYYDGVYYGDWSVFAADKLGDDEQASLQEFEQEKANLNGQPSVFTTASTSFDAPANASPLQDLLAALRQHRTGNVVLMGRQMGRTAAMEQMLGRQTRLGMTSTPDRDAEEDDLE